YLIKYNYEELMKKDVYNNLIEMYKKRVIEYTQIEPFKETMLHAEEINTNFVTVNINDYAQNFAFCNYTILNLDIANSFLGFEAIIETMKLDIKNDQIGDDHYVYNSTTILFGKFVKMIYDQDLEKNIKMTIEQVDKLVEISIDLFCILEKQQ